MAGKLNAIRAKSYFSAPANYGSAFTSCWDNNERERTMGITLEEMEKILEERGCSMAKKYTLDETADHHCRARKIHDGENVVLGVGLPTNRSATGQGPARAARDPDDGIRHH